MGGVPILRAPPRCESSYPKPNPTRWPARTQEVTGEHDTWDVALPISFQSLAFTFYELLYRLRLYELLYAFEAHYFIV